MSKRVRWWTFGGGCAERYTHDGKRVAFVSPEPGDPEWWCDLTEAGGVFVEDGFETVTGAMAKADADLRVLGFELDGPEDAQEPIGVGAAAALHVMREAERASFRKIFPAEAKEYEEAECAVRELQSAIVRMFTRRGTDAFEAVGYVKANLHVVERWQLALCAYEVFCMRHVQPMRVEMEGGR